MTDLSFETFLFGRRGTLISEERKGIIPGQDEYITPGGRESMSFPAERNPPTGKKPES